VRLTPAQVGMALLLGASGAPPLSSGDLKADIRRGRGWLVSLAGGQDFGYDAMSWHEFLWSTGAGGYRWGRRSADKWARHVRAGMGRPGWAEAVRELEAEGE